MSWQELLQSANESRQFAWLGGRSLRFGPRSWAIAGKLPEEFGWYWFDLSGRKAKYSKPSDPNAESLKYNITGYLVGDRIISDSARVDPDPKNIIAVSEQVYIIEPGLDRFVRVKAGRESEDGPLIFCNQEMPLGPEEDVLQAFLSNEMSVDKIKNVVPALDAAFRMEVFRREEAEKRRAELERLRREENERILREERRRELVEKLGDAVSRREMAKVDFEAAARSALAIGGAVYLDHRKAYRQHEVIVRFRFSGRRFECVCDDRTLRIIDAGICLTDHNTGEKGDDRFSLETLPAIIKQAIDLGVLHVFRHAE